VGGKGAKAYIFSQIKGGGGGGVGGGGGPRDKGGPQKGREFAGPGSDEDEGNRSIDLLVVPVSTFRRKYGSDAVEVGTKGEKGGGEIGP